MLVSMGHSVSQAQRMPLWVVNQVLELEAKKEVDEWRRTRWLACIVANSQGAKLKPTDLLKLPGDAKTRIDKETLKKLSHGRKKV